MTIRLNKLRHYPVSFYGESSDPQAVVGAMYSRHVELASHWIPFDLFLNGNPVAMVRGRYGMFAAGPLPLMEGYAAVFDHFGISATVTDPKIVWSPSDVFSSSDELGILILSNKSYVVAQKFNANQLHGSD